MSDILLCVHTYKKILDTINHQKVLITPLNWGWGHATRCVPIINKIIVLGYVPVIAADGDALTFLRKEFPALEYHELPSYNIRYYRFFALGMLWQLPKIGFAILREYWAVKNMIQKDTSIVAMINDNRLGVFHPTIKSVYITHQLNIQAGIFSKLVNSVHHFFIKKHQQCWVPDNQNQSLSGKLSVHPNINPVYIGWLSRFEFSESIPKKYDLLVLLSGIESQRAALEKILIKQLKTYQGSVLFVRGVFNADKLDFPANFTLVDSLFGADLKRAIQCSRVILCRSGYSTLMDLAILQANAIVIPTLGQTEQEYLAQHLEKTNQAIVCNEVDFDVSILKSPLKSFQRADDSILEKTLVAFLES